MPAFSDGESGLAVRTKLNNLMLPVYNVKDYGALGDASHDDTTNIQSAIDAAIAAGGGTVYFPPVGTSAQHYKLTASLDFDSAGASVPVNLVGVGKAGNWGSRIRGNFADWMISHQHSLTNKQVLRRISGLYITNVLAGAKGIIWHECQTGIIDDCTIQATLTTLEVTDDAYCAQIRNCDILGGGATTAGSVGAYVGQTTVSNCSFTGCESGIVAQNSGVQISGSRFEVCATGIIVGQNVAGASSAVSGCLIAANSFERNNIGVYVRSGSGIAIVGNMCSGTASVNDGVAISTTSWSGNVATVNTSTPHGLGAAASTKAVLIAGVTPTAYNGTFLATVVDTDTFTYPLVVSNPGAGSGGFVYQKPLSGFKLASMEGLIAGNVISTHASVACIDAAAAVGTRCTLVGNDLGTGDGITGVSLLMPTTNKSNFTVLDPFYASIAIAFADLPSSPVEGMEFNLSNANTETWGASITTTGAFHVKVRYNGTNWTVVGK